MYADPPFSLLTETSARVQEQSYHLFTSRPRLCPDLFHEPVRTGIFASQALAFKLSESLVLNCPEAEFYTIRKLVFTLFRMFVFGYSKPCFQLFRSQVLQLPGHLAQFVIPCLSEPADEGFFEELIHLQMEFATQFYGRTTNVPTMVLQAARTVVEASFAYRIKGT